MSSLNPTARSFTPPSTSASPTATATATATATRRIVTFPQIQYLQEELVLLIFSFIADVPYESSTTASESTLTHVIPLVSKDYNTMYTKSNYLWKHALIRLVEDQPKTWGHGMKSFLRTFPLPNGSSNPIIDNQMDYNDDNDDNDNDNNYILDEIELVHAAGKSMKNILRSHNGYFSRESNNNDDTTTTTTTATTTPTQTPIFIELYRYILSNFIRFTSPLFYMPDRITIGNEFGIHFFEPRYRTLIGEVMSPYPNSFKNGDPITPDTSHLYHPTNLYPSFIYANKSPLKRGTSACIVEVRQCVIHHNQTADVFLMPVSYVRIEHVWERPGSHNLYEGSVMKMGDLEAYETVEQRRLPAMYTANTGGVGGGGDDGIAIGRRNGENATDYINSVLLRFMQAAEQGNNNHDSDSDSDIDDDDDDNDE
jgi:hypothetical protein